MQEALRAAVERIVYTSRVATLALTADGGPRGRSLLHEWMNKSG
jgi:hypothetical protein